MPLSTVEAESLAADLIARHSALLHAQGTLGRVERYLRGEHDLPYIPRGARSEYRQLAARSITNWLPLIADTFAKALFVDGYRPARSVENADPWAIWQANRMDARQTLIHKGALEYGTSYVLVLPGDPEPVMRPLSALRAIAFYEDSDDEWPRFGIFRVGRSLDGKALFRLVDENAVYTLEADLTGGTIATSGSGYTLATGSTPRVVAVDEHGLGVTPMVRFRERLDEDPMGIVRPLLPMQDRVNEVVFSTQIAMQYASFRQRWATGLAIPTDDEGNPIEPFQAAVDRLWVTDSPDAKFGDFAQTDVNGHIRAYETTVRSLAAIAQTPPNVLLGDMTNLSADALAQAEASTQRKVGEYETLFGESWEQALRLAAAAKGDFDSAGDTSAQVRWRDTEARSLAQTVDALGKMAQMLSIPAEGLWDRVPGVTDQDVERWKALREDGDVLGALVTEMNRSAGAAIPQE
jgi:hypothetical protein